MSPRPVTCPACGYCADASIDSAQGFQIRGQHHGKAIRRCGRCGGGFSLGLFSGLMVGSPTAIPRDQWARMEEIWRAHFVANAPSADRRLTTSLGNSSQLSPAFPQGLTMTIPEYSEYCGGQLFLRCINQAKQTEVEEADPATSLGLDPQGILCAMVLAQCSAVQYQAWVQLRSIDHRACDAYITGALAALRRQSLDIGWSSFDLVLERSATAYADIFRTSGIAGLVGTPDLELGTVFCEDYLSHTDRRPEQKAILLILGQALWKDLIAQNKDLIDMAWFENPPLVALT